MHLKPGTLLKGGTYRIERFINSGGFGCTYEAVHTSLDDKFAIKEFFVKDFCNRDEDTYHVTVGTHSKKALVEKLKKKFIEEAKSIRKLHHNGIVRVSDVFEENGTAYYVMDYIEGRSLKEIVEAKGKLSETEALRYIRQVSETLKYVHSKNMLHLDIKPGNIMIDEDDTAILIDFGTSKQYDEVDGENTSTLLGKTPGYAPLEQMDNSVQEFYPATDIYALGATMYKMLSGITPPNAIARVAGRKMEMLPSKISEKTNTAVYTSMQILKEKRPQSIAEFLKFLDVKAEEVKEKPEDEGTDIDIFVEPDPELDPKPKPKSWMLYAILAVVLGVVGYFVYAGIDNKNYQTMLSDRQSYISLIGEGDKLLYSNNYTESINKYEQAQTYEKKYSSTKYSEEFDKGASDKISSANEAAAEYAKYKGHEYVDLGLPSGIKWATCNVGANKPENEGKCFAWGETEPAPNNDYSSSNSATYGLGYSKLQSRGYIDSEGNLKPQYDAARSNWGGSWRLPTREEMEELEENCTWNWTKQGGEEGYKVTGPNGNSIFLPAARYRYGASSYGAGAAGSYWSSTPDRSDSNYAYSLNFNKSNQYVYWSSRYYGRSVRPVSE